MDDVDLAAIAEARGVPIAFHEFGQDAPDGMYVYDGEQSLIVANASKLPQRQRFTVAHELGHHELHRFRGPQQLVDLDVGSDRRADGTKDLDEVAANSFAAHLLLPAGAIRQALGDVRNTDVKAVHIVDLVRRHRVSWEMVCFRLKSESIIRRVDLDRLLAEPRVAIYEANGIGPAHFAIDAPRLPAALSLGAAKLWAGWVITDERLGQILELDVGSALAQMRSWGIARGDRAEESAAHGAQQLEEAGVDLDALVADLAFDEDDA
ncbi:ImmA/IrrE family metallo-endopeptidase [Solirubrobacter ginsenosidimutans]|uniref:ImmA/IrrE family metallo-endopeptidase n=1 Tax=Solirubrobacter ginsenosidimutans TaxID=490573 RepID=A0A9X3MYJ4_9ACTN|nr:ImmA/IrrE family metallo-endopeptidase [Solirubrobacter ginsenosidimutans]MDA0161813.1 ImmA/IrrE family metallo-endopeptidase [Solirubrobacter ginsenosidimutans]